MKAEIIAVGTRLSIPMPNFYLKNWRVWGLMSIFRQQ